MKYLNKKMIVVINKLSYKLTGGMSCSDNNIRDGASLNFVDNIFHNEIFGQSIYPDIYHQAAAYMFFITMNHIFNDGNKRTGLASAITFLSWNGIKFSPLNEDTVFEFVIKIANGSNNPKIAIPEIAKWLKQQAIEE